MLRFNPERTCHLRDMKVKLFTVQEAAEVRGISPKAIYAAIASERIPRLYDQGNLVVRETDLVRWDSLKKRSGRRQGEAMSAENKARIAEGQRRRWQERKRTKGKTKK